jgi:hypothetical protein
MQTSEEIRGINLTPMFEMLKIRKAVIDPQLRTRLERYGVPVIQQMLSHVRFRDEEGFANIETYQAAIMAWLTEEHDRAERKANMSLAMEAGILILVALEVAHIVRHW